MLGNRKLESKSPLYDSYPYTTNTFSFYLYRTARQAEIEKIEADIRKLSRRRAGEDSDDEPRAKKPKKSYLQQELDKYARGRGLQRKNKDGGRKNEDDVIAALNSFRGLLKNSGMFATKDTGEGRGEREEDENGDESKDGKAPEGIEEATLEIDDDRGFMSHALHFPKDDGEESRKAERDYEVIDPRQRGARAKEEAREKRKAMREAKYRR